ncbi:Uncharacterized conserved protein [Cedecea neteri]|uniref:Uncharacterized conserved protein n=1 Tax=Cedecea neteri TaxID=158822 RepID=A0A2X3JGC7_9ENTR|nr:BPL-N domain-containing protein [Cedecea neteri]SQC93795.1 Uncharacterized conserved protein [Cedecea neteri]
MNVLHGLNVFRIALSAFLFSPFAAEASNDIPLKIAIYRGAAGCEDCSEMVAKSLQNSGKNIAISYIGENEKLKLTRQNLSKFDLYVQPGGGQDIPAAYDAIGDDGAQAIREFVRRGKGYLGLCMGAYLADKDWIGLIDKPLESEAGRPGSGVADEGDYTLNIRWGNKTEPFYYQDGPYFNHDAKSSGFTPVARYSNGDVAIAAYRYGKGKVVLTGPHPEADGSWFDNSVTGHTSPQSKMTRLLTYLNTGSNGSPNE